MPICEVWLTTDTCANSDILLIRSTVKAAEQRQWGTVLAFSTVLAWSSYYLTYWESCSFFREDPWDISYWWTLFSPKHSQDWNQWVLFVQRGIMGFSCKEFRRSAPGGLYDYAGKSSAQQTKACCLVMLCVMLAWTFFWLTEMISRCWARNFLQVQKWEKRESTYLHLNDCIH